jgi:hypothetical protein
VAGRDGHHDDLGLVGPAVAAAKFRRR